MKALIHCMRKRTDGGREGGRDTVNIHGVTEYVLTCWKNKGSKARRKKVAGWKRAQFLPHKVGTNLVFFSKGPGGGGGGSWRLHKCLRRNVNHYGTVPGVGLKEKGGFQITKPCRGNCNFAVQTFSISWEYNCPHCEFVKTPKVGYLLGFSLWGLPW